MALTPTLEKDEDEGESEESQDLLSNTLKAGWVKMGRGLAGLVHYSEFEFVTFWWPFVVHGPHGPHVCCAGPVASHGLIADFRL